MGLLQKNFCYNSLNRYVDAVNMGFLIGHTSLHTSVMADFERVATKDEIKIMIELMEKP